MVMAIGDQSAPPPVQSGIIPQDVVSVVSIIGLKRSFAAFLLLSSNPFPSSNSLPILSINTIASLMMIPANEIIPKKAVKLKNDPAPKSPAVTPINDSGIVIRMMLAFRIELN